MISELLLYSLAALWSRCWRLLRRWRLWSWAKGPKIVCWRKILKIWCEREPSWYGSWNFFCNSFKHHSYYWYSELVDQDSIKRQEEIEFKHSQQIFNWTDSEFLCTTVWELLFLPCFANVVTTNTSLRWIDWAHFWLLATTGLIGWFLLENTCFVPFFFWFCGKNK